LVSAHLVCTADALGAIYTQRTGGAFPVGGEKARAMDAVQRARTITQLRSRYADRVVSAYTGEQFSDYRVADGWAAILDALFEDLFAQGWDGRLQEVKEKYGELSILACGTVEMDDAIVAAEAASERTCVVCGAPGRPRVGGAPAAVCDEHADGRASTDQP
jgi:hypothetical protein